MSFKFVKNGKLWKPTINAVEKDRWDSVDLIGYAASLSSEDDRPIIATGYWDLEGHVVERCLMRLRPSHMYVGTSDYFRGE
jgi:hypothetical protein